MLIRNKSAGPKRSRMSHHYVLSTIEPLERRTLLSAGYAIQAVAQVGDPLPNPADGIFTSDFETGGINSRGQIVFTSEQGKPDAAHDQGETIFLTRSGGQGPIAELNLPGKPAPGGGTFDGPIGSLSQDAINDQGDAAFGFTLGSTVPYNAGIYRYSHVTGALTAVEVPGVTDAPTGGKFMGAWFNPSLNNQGDLAFIGVIPTTSGFNPASGLGEAVFMQNAQGKIIKLVAPGDPAPGGSSFDSFQNTSVNDQGDVAFGAHVAGDVSLGGDGTGLGAFQSAYLRYANGQIVSIGHQGQTIPASAGGGVYDAVYTPKVNNRDQVAFTAGLRTTPPQTNVLNDPQAIFFFSRGRTVAVARPGQAMPGGGTFASAGTFASQVGMNDRGQVVFAAKLNDGSEGVYQWSHGILALIARTGTNIPGAGTISSFDQFGPGTATAFASNNSRGQVAFGAVLSNGNAALLLATPQGNNEGNDDQGSQSNGSQEHGTSASNDDDDPSKSEHVHESLFTRLRR